MYRGFAGIEYIKTKKSMRSNLLVIALVSIALTFTGCQQNEQEYEQKDDIPVVTFQMSPSLDEVEDFLELLGDYRDGYDSDQCYNVTPKDISNNYDFRIFKFDTSCSSFLLYDNEIYPLGRWFGGYGVTSFAITDLNKDGELELFFTYSWGSGMIYSQIGYFDTASKETVIFDFSNRLGEMLLGTDQDQVLCIYNADYHIKSFVDIEMHAGEKIASIIFDDDKISIVEESKTPPQAAGHQI